MISLTQKHYYGVDFDFQRNALLQSKAARPFLEEVIRKADSALSKTIEVLKISEYMEFCETRNRKSYEKKYFERRNDASFLSIALWLTRDEKYIRPLTDHVFCICDEFSWCVPAHSFIWENRPVESVIKYVDLFMAETARLLTDIAVSVGKLLPYYVTDRIQYEIHRRVINAYLEYDHFHWEDYTNNWPGVCAGGTLTALLHFGTKKEIAAILPRLYKAAHAFLSGYGEDGCCLEGYAYWNYGFGYFVSFARMILEYTNGEINYFKCEKVKKIASYAQKIRMGTSKNAAFSDADSEFSFSIGLISYLKALYPENISLPRLDLGTLRGSIYSLKELLWFDPDYQEAAQVYGEFYFEDAQWFIHQGEQFSFAAKGGHNGEPHNHNDVGSFLIVVKDTMPLADLGRAEYTRDNFDEAVRYTILNNGSQGHSVPIIDGHYQCPGEMYKATNVLAQKNAFSLELSGAYEGGLISKLHRSFEIREHSVLLKDIYEYTEKTGNIKERFITYTSPVVSDGAIDLETAQLSFDPQKYRAAVTEAGCVNHATLKPIPVYLIDILPVQETETDFIFEIMIRE